VPEYAGTHEGRGLRFGIAVSRFNSFITDRLLEGARSALRENGVAEPDITVTYVPGAFELPLAAKRLAQSGRYDAVLCLGCVIRGETDHYEHVAGAATRGVMDAGLETDLPVIFGVLTTDTVQQARDRAGTDGNKGAESAMAGLEMATLLRSLCSEGGNDR
jgi:6,7-dimethyl-8-ribityllumazine synthase